MVKYRLLLEWEVLVFFHMGRLGDDCSRVYFSKELGIWIFV
jgi:hypothetical protein